ncbi:MAG: hypothetical protein P1U68_07395 [Verrucomicrobiales bacterium]|nr:hypothetical protein [Verrucomicrobiales bacterium]
MVESPAFAGMAGSGEGGAGDGSVYYTFKNSGDLEGGGVAVVNVDPGTGEIISQEVVGQQRLFMRPHKLKLSTSGRFLLATSQHAGINNLLLADLEAGTHQFLSVDRIPDDIGTWDDYFVVGAEERMAYIIDAATGKISHRWNGTHQLRPDGRRIEYVATTSDGVAWTSWQKDSASGNSKGSRVVTIDIVTGKTLGDLQLPRSMPQLHLADGKERGPNPEIIIPSRRTNTLLLSMDLYGGVAMADLDAAKDGAWKDLTYESVAVDESWGTAFPDRAVLCPSGGNDFVLMANAGADGGVSWIDLIARKVVQRIQTPPGLAAPVVVSGGRYIVSPVAGKTKKRSFGRLVESRNPLKELYVFEVVGSSGNPRLESRSVPLPVKVDLVSPLSPASNDLVLLTAGDEILTLKSASGELVDRKPAVGEIFRITTR